MNKLRKKKKKKMKKRNENKTSDVMMALTGREMT